MSRHVLVTGGGSGVGAAIARRLDDAGWAVTVLGRRREPLEGVADGLKRGGVELADVTDPSAMEQAFARAEVARGPLDAVIANAGGTSSSPAHRTSVEAFRQNLELNLTSAFTTARLALPGMLERRWGRVVFIASTAGLKGYGYVAPYCAAKHGVVGLARALAVETATKGVTVNAVCPGYTETPMLEATLANIRDKTGLDDAAARASLLKGVPNQRFVQPDEVAASVAYLLSDAASAVTGHALAVAGGEV